MDMTTLLIVDEEVNTRLLYKDEFQDEGYEVTVAETAEEAMEKIHQSKPNIITLHLKMPGARGFEFLKKIKEEESDIPVVLYSANAGYKKDSRIGGCDAFVVQSADLTELKMTIKLILSHKQSDLVLSLSKMKIPIR
jgi:DNA-binding NtrC family response regulator